MEDTQKMIQLKYAVYKDLFLMLIAMTITVFVSVPSMPTPYQQVWGIIGAVLGTAAVVF